MLEKIKEKVMNSKLIHTIFKGKTYFDIGINHVSWFTGKLPELMGALYILEKFNVVIIPSMIIIIAVSVFVSVIMFGYLLKASGIWIQERKVAANIDPITNEIYEAAKKINKVK